MRYKNILTAAMMALFALSAFVATPAQSTDQSNPTPIAANELVVKGPKKNNQQYYYSFTAGPGEVTLTLNVKVKSSSTFVGIKVFDAELNTLTYHNMSADTSSPGMALKKFDVGEKQTLLMSFTSDASLAECRIKLGGAVEFGSASAGETPPAGADPAATPPADATPVPADAGAGETPATGETSATGTLAGLGKNKAFTMSILDAVGQRFNIPANGKLRIEMKDGSVQEIDLTQVKKILIRK